MNIKGRKSRSDNFSFLFTLYERHTESGLGKHYVRSSTRKERGFKIHIQRTFCH